MSKAKEIAAALFPKYPTVNEFHITSDGQAFEVKAMAENHAKTLEQVAVETITRNKEEVDEVKVPDENTSKRKKK